MAVSVQEAFGLAKEAMGNVSAPEMATWISTHLGLTVKPLVLKVMMGSFLEREQQELTRLKAVELLERAKSEEPAKKPKQRKTPASPRSTRIVQCSPQASEQSTTSQSCPECGSGDYVFRGRKKGEALPGEEGLFMETKHRCRVCGCEWKVRKPL